jgi:pimeloyl-ACP methyl ester carboxylesterase
MKKVLFIFLAGLGAFFIVVLVFVFAASATIPEGGEEIIEEVLISELPNQVVGDSGRVVSGEVQIWYESIAPEGKSRGTILLIMGLGGNAIEWPLYFTQPLVEAGYHVIRFDNRSTGLSTWTDEGFSLQDNAADAFAVMDVLGIKSAHLFGMSMGGMIAQLMAINQPGRVESLISFMASGDMNDPELPTVSHSCFMAIMATGLRYGIPNSERNVSRATLGVRNVLSPELSETRMKALAEQALFNVRFRRGFNSNAFVQQTRAVMGAESRLVALRELDVPTLVIHGKEDPLIPHEHAVKLASQIPNAQLLLLDGMGHDVSPEHTPIVHQALFRFLSNVPGG